jgi:CRISPR-associated endonuclease Csn1
MMKHRGHFLLSGDMQNIKEFKSNYLEFIQAVENEELDCHLSRNDEDIALIEQVLQDKSLTKSMKKKKLIDGLGVKGKCDKELLALLTGGKAKLSKIFDQPELDEIEKPSISFSDAAYEDYEETVRADLGEQFYIIEHAKAIYDWAMLVDILGNQSSLSEAKIDVYEKHKKDLRYLKKLVKEELGIETYKKIFSATDEKKNYCSYIGMTMKNGKKIPLSGSKCIKDDFYSYLKKQVVEKISDAEKTKYLTEEIERGTFLPKQVIKDNGVIPYQVHLFELNQIINNLKTGFLF